MVSLYTSYSKVINATAGMVTDTRLNIGVTGLSRAGKTVFLVSAIQNLEPDSKAYALAKRRMPS